MTQQESDLPIDLACDGYLGHLSENENLNKVVPM
jgi:hypothetical protein